MESKNKIYAFASKWLNNFTNTKLNYTTFVEEAMGEECKYLGFIMDCGERFKAKYGDAFNDSEALGKIINEVSDIELLGSAIFSQWRYFNHWAYTGAEILEENNRNWFIIALSRLQRLAANCSFAFDGNRHYEMINKIAINYYRHIKVLINDETTYREYSERIVVDRGMKMIELVSNHSDGMKESHKYEDGDKINKLLDYFSYQDFFVLNDENIPLSENDNISRDYQITIEYDNGNKKVLSGCFDREGLPVDYDDFASKIKAITDTNSFNDILDSSIYDKSRRYDENYIYCSVIFSSDSSKTYYYYTDDHDIKVGDYVIVEAGKDNIEKCVKVVKVECFKARFLPRPIEATKKIIRKCYRDEIDFDDYIDDDDDYFDIDEYDIFQKRFKD